jgi:hypothetical protein
MKLTYETAIATFIQFVSITLLSVGTTIVSIVSSCHGQSDQCTSNSIVSLIFFMLLAGWFACLWVVGYAAQERRSKRLGQLLIAAEVVVAMVALFNAKHHTDPLSLITSITDFCLSLWVILLAYRLIKAGGGRIINRQRRRRPRAPLAPPGRDHEL